MKEFIEKLIGRLEEREILLAPHAFELSMAGGCTIIDEMAFGSYRELGVVKEIVKELAEEHKGGWIPCSERLPEEDGKQYIVQKTNGYIDVLCFTKDAYKLSKYDFYEYKGRKQPVFYEYDSEYGYIDWECVAWQPLPDSYKEPERVDRN